MHPGATQPAPHTPARTTVRQRRLILGLAALVALTAIGTYAVLGTRGGGEQIKPNQNTVHLSAPVLRFGLKRAPGALRSARGIAEVVQRKGKYQLRVLAVGLRPVGGDNGYRVYFANTSGEKTLGRVGTDERGTLVGVAKIASGDLKRFTELRVGTDSTDSQRTVLVGHIPD